MLIVDDEADLVYALRMALEKDGFSVSDCGDGERALGMIGEIGPDVIFLDVALPGLDGLSVLEELRRRKTQIPTIVLTGHGTMDTAIRALQLGAYDYLTKPLDLQGLRQITRRALELKRLREEVNVLRIRLDERSEGTNLVGNSPPIQEVFKAIGIVTATPAYSTVLIRGDTGTGKELVARVIHERGPTAGHPFVAVNCSVLPENLLENELFGHEKGAYTGADAPKEGRLAQAGKGTLFFDEIGDLPAPLQLKLLRLIQEREYEPLGGGQTQRVEARLVFATHCDLEKAVREGRFREDLFFRINVFPIRIPPLRERLEDLPLLVSHFLTRASRRHGASVPSLSREAMQVLLDYHFPGNVRELENAIEHAVISARGGLILPDNLPAALREKLPASLDIPMTSRNLQRAREDILSAFERKFVRTLLASTQGNVAQAAKEAGVERQSFHRLMKKHGIHGDEFRPR